MILFGNILMGLIAISCLLTITLFGLAGFKDKKFTRPAKSMFGIFAIIVVVTALFFLSQILNHNFELEYVFSYSSVSLNFFLLLSTFWAGQVGTFMLWLLFTVIFGVFLVRVKWEHHNRVMFFYLLTSFFLVVLLLVKSPFAPLDTQAMGIGPEHLPLQDGRGLNPLLQNFWMVIHPPIVFLGYTALAIPFAFALAALSANDFSTWARKVFPWSLISSSILGLGIFLGGYWAYETLGWGGYWAWDPVENSSLIPWLTNLAMIHGLLIEHQKGTLRKTNLLMGLAGYLLVLYGTFLTRSGILQEFSVHSFTDLGINTYLILFMVLFTVISIVLFIMRLPSLKKEKPEKTTEESSEGGSTNWYETMLILGALFTILLAVLTWVGTSWPLITTIFKQPANVDANFYNTIALPISVIMAVLTGLSVLYVFRHRGVAFFRNKVIISAAVGVIAVIVGFLLGVRQFNSFLLIFISFFAILANLLAIQAMSAKKVTSIAGHITHIGFGILLVGFLVSSVYSRSSGVIKLEGGKETDVFGMHCRFTGIGEEFFSSSNRVDVDVKSDAGEYVARAAYYQDPYTQQIVINPYIKKHLWEDVYFSPQRYLSDYETLTLTKQQTDTAYGYPIKFVNFEVGSHESSGAMKVGAELEITVGDSVYTITPIYQPNVMTAGEDDLYVRIPESDYKVYIQRINADQGSVIIDIVGIGDLVLEISRKPLINLVWFGSVIIVLGTFVAYIKRRKLALKK